MSVEDDLREEIKALREENQKLRERLAEAEARGGRINVELKEILDRLEELNKPR